MIIMIAIITQHYDNVDDNEKKMQQKIYHKFFSTTHDKLI